MHQADLAVGLGFVAQSILGARARGLKSFHLPALAVHAKAGAQVTVKFERTRQVVELGDIERPATGVTVDVPRFRRAGRETFLQPLDRGGVLRYPTRRGYGRG